MGYPDKFYFGQSKLYVSADTGSTVTVTNGTKTWTDVAVNNMASFTIPGTSKYTVTVGAETKDVFLNYGDCQKISFR